MGPGPGTDGLLGTRPCSRSGRGPERRAGTASGPRWRRPRGGWQERAGEVRPCPGGQGAGGRLPGGGSLRVPPASPGRGLPTRAAPGGRGGWPFPGLPAACPATVPGRRGRHESGRNGENGRGAAGAATAVPLELSLARPALAEVLHAQLCSNFTETRGSRARPVAQLSPRGSGRPVSSLRSRGSSAGRRGGARAGGAGPVLGGVPLGGDGLLQGLRSRLGVLSVAPHRL